MTGHGRSAKSNRGCGRINVRCGRSDMRCVTVCRVYCGPCIRKLCGQEELEKVSLY